MARRVTRLVGWVALVLLASLALARMFFFRTYYVEGQSMEPTIHGAETGGDFVLVTHGGAADLERFDLVLVLPSGEKRPKIKRAGGLPGEAVAVRDGDLWIDGARLDAKARRPAPVPIFDERLEALEPCFLMVDPWRRVEGGWELDAREVKAGSRAGSIFMHRSLEDHYYRPDGGLAAGSEPVGDAILECEVRRGDPPARLRFGLLEDGDTFEAVIEPPGEDGASVRLDRRNPAGAGTLVEGRVSLSPEWHHIRFANVDDRVTLAIDGSVVLEHRYEQNVSRGPEPVERGKRAATERVFLGGEEGRAFFRGIRVLRDLHYTFDPAGRYADREEIQLGPDEIFVLGDNSRQSRDGRHWGPTPLREVKGRPLAVLWPLERIRLLSPRGPE